MDTYNKRILLSVTGMSPAVVTETLYALVTEKNFIPTEIQVITTIQGRNKLLSTLLGIEAERKERKGALQEFIEDYGSQYGFDHIHFNEDCIHIIEDTNGEQLPDIRTPKENEHAANSIVQLVGKLCQDDETQLHVSIAGGRKTMGFFMGYALSLYGREQDSLSHVLVDEEFETLSNFYYRKPKEYRIVNEKNGKELDASQANIMLAEIPWVRLGLGVSEELLKNTISYSDSVNKAQQILDTPSLKFLAPVEGRKVQFGSQIVALSPRGYSLLLSLVISKLQGWQYVPHREQKRITELYFAIYDMLTFDNDHIKERLADFDELKNVLSESRTDIRKKVKQTFSLGKEGKTDYIPSSSRATACYELNIASERIDITGITKSIEKLL
ncbi:CRISPR-associated ring nuclease Csm6 [Aggregatibacter kilianii]|uniref:CRISPR-associated ring nuclease Csm6 n=1 Tax=Aggregatibacter kilianii TaxID=2025884 RepID=UPI0028E64402|nr:CRISPR-associated ring nuclease Csm6 [Aggregatibacter kilianii]